tara:strand:- start:143 stop:1987 length:1845 start_codon:yes stop_codon:yes gene_type:complete
MTYSGSPNPDPGEVKRDEETLQRQREEKAEQDRLEEERRILEQEVPYWRRQEQIEGGEFIEDPEGSYYQEGPHYQSIALETGIGIATDFATVGLLGIPIVGQGLYYGTNFTVGYAANALAQWMRGDWDNFSQGEALAAGGFQTIPMGTTAKGLKGLRKAATKGALGGVTMAQLEVGVDERRRLTTRELMLSGILGGTVAGGFKSAELGGEFIDNTRRQITGLTTGLAGTSISDMSAKKEWRWKRFGYPEDVEPSQVKTRDKNNNRNDYTPSEKASVEDSLEEFYDKVQLWERSGKKADKYPLYWLNPVTGDMYRAGKRSGALKGKRLSLISKNRYIRATIQSSKEQKKAVGQIQKEINEKNSKLKEYYTEIRDNYLYILNQFDKEIIPFALPRLTGKPGSDKYMQGKAAIDKVNRLTKERNVYAQELEDLVKGKYGLYGEHGYNVNNERVQRIVQTIPNYSLGDATNFHPVLNVDGFKEFKNLLEEVLNEVKPNTKMYNYPDYVLNYNPNLYPAPDNSSFTKQNIDRILRIEWLTSLHMGDKKGTYGRVLLGDVVRLDGFPNGIPYDQIPKDVRKGNKETIRKWLKKIGVKSMPTQAMERQTRRVDPTKKNINE